jgi:TRAP-type mannitol/chloroaromatic compound transport system permease small subunit
MDPGLSVPSGGPVFPAERAMPDPDQPATGPAIGPMAGPEAERDLADELLAGRRHRLGRMPRDMPGWMALTVLVVDTLNLWIGRTVAWLVLPLMFAMVYEITARYVFVAPTIWAYDVSRMLYGAMFMLGAAYALSRGVHIRADFLYRNWSVKVQGRVDTILYLFLYFPALLIFAKISFDYAAVALARGERGMDTAWMPQLGPIKAALALGVALLVLQGIAELFKSWYAATRGRWPDA